MNVLLIALIIFSLTAFIHGAEKSLNLTAYQENNRIIFEISSPGEEISINIVLLKDGIQIDSKMMSGFDHIKSYFDIENFGNYTLKVYNINRKETAIKNVFTEESTTLEQSLNTTQAGQLRFMLFNENYIWIGVIIITGILIYTAFGFRKKTILKKK